MLLLEGHTSPIYALAFSPDGRYLASGTRDGAVWLWDEGLERHELLQADPQIPRTINAADFHPSGEALAICDDTGWRIRSLIPEGVQPAVSSYGLHSISGVRYLSETLLVEGYGYRARPAPGVLALWDLKKNRPREPRFPSPHGVRTVAVHPPSQRVAWSEWGGSQTGPRLTVWDITSPDQTRINLTHNCPSLSFHPDGHHLAAASEWGARIFEITRKQERFALKGHKGIVSSVAYCPDGRAIATGSWDGTVRLWSPENGRETACYQWPVGKVFALAYSPDGLRLAAAGEKGTIMIWDLD